MRSVRVQNDKATSQTTETPEPQKTALERIADALEDIAFHLSDEGAIGEKLYLIWDRLEDITPEGDRGHRFLRTLDIGRD